jgi:hypothetical protein
MNAHVQKLTLSGFILLLSACAHYPSNYGGSSGNYPYSSGGYPQDDYPSGGYYPDPGYQGYGNYQRQQRYYPRQPAPGYGGYGQPYGGYRNNNYYQNNNYYGRPQPRPYPQPGYNRGHNDHDHGNYSNEYRGDHHGDRGNGQQWNRYNGNPNREAWQGRNNQPQPRRQQPVVINQDNRRFNGARRQGPPNAGWQQGQNRNDGNANRQRNWDRTGGGGQGQNNQRQVRQQPMGNPQGGRPYPPRDRQEQGNGAWAGRQQRNNLNWQTNQASQENRHVPPPALQRRLDWEAKKRRNRRQMDD